MIEQLEQYTIQHPTEEQTAALIGEAILENYDRAEAQDQNAPYDHFLTKPSPDDMIEITKYYQDSTCVVIHRPLLN